MNAGRWRLGVEGGVQGDPNYESYKAGAVASVKLENELEVRIAGGGVFQDDKNAKPYLSVGFSVLF